MHSSHYKLNSFEKKYLKKIRKIEKDFDKLIKKQIKNDGDENSPMVIALQRQKVAYLQKKFLTPIDNKIDKFNEKYNGGKPSNKQGGFLELIHNKAAKSFNEYNKTREELKTVKEEIKKSSPEQKPQKKKRKSIGERLSTLSKIFKKRKSTPPPPNYKKRIIRVQQKVSDTKKDPKQKEVNNNTKKPPKIPKRRK